MPVKLKYNPGRTTTKHSILGSRIFRIALLTALGCFALGIIIFTVAYYHYQHVVDDRLASGPIFANVSQIYAAPREVRTGQKLTAASIARDLRQAGYNANPQLGTFQLTGDDIRIKPGPDRKSVV